MNGAPNKSHRVLIIDDEPVVRELLSVLMTSQGLEPILSADGEAALQLLRQGVADMVLLDIEMPDIDGMTVLREVRKFDTTTPIIVLTAHGTIHSAVEAIKLGAFDYLTKPFPNTDLIVKVQRALEMRQLTQENHYLRSQTEREGSLTELMGPSREVRRLICNLERVAPTDFTVVITGETGSGKELVARAIHRMSPRRSGPFVPVDCGAIQPNLIESELFGHERGAFSGAERTRSGKFEQAQGGTLFLDEIQNLPVAVQTRFLRALQERQICHVGGNKMIDIDLRVVAATNVDLLSEIDKGQFRQDLYHRLNEFSVAILPLRQRRDDILYLTKRFIDLTQLELRKHVQTLTHEAIEQIIAYPWPGNVRELRNVIRKAVLLADDRIEADHLGMAGAYKIPDNLPVSFEESLVSCGDEILPLKDHVRKTIAETERHVLLHVLRQTGGNKSKAARLLQIDYKTMLTKIRQYCISLSLNGSSLLEE